jgi:hypothetical protein
MGAIQYHLAAEFTFSKDSQITVLRNYRISNFVSIKAIKIEEIHVIQMFSTLTCFVEHVFQR